MKTEFHGKNDTIYSVLTNINTIYSIQKRGEQLLFQKNVINVVVKNFTQKKAGRR